MSEEEKKQAEPWKQLLAKTLQYRDEPSTSEARQAIAMIRKGANRSTESWAYPYVIPYASHYYQQTPLLRAIGLVAEFKDVPAYESEDSYCSVGTCLFKASKALAEARGEKFTPDPNSPDAIGQRLALIGSLNLESAVQTFRSLLALVRSVNGSMNYYDLVTTILYWGNGFDKRSRSIRDKLLRDYYSAYSAQYQTSEK